MQTNASKRFRPNGLMVFVILILLGLGGGAGFFRYKSAQVAEEMRESSREFPTTAEGRLKAWMEIGASQIHRRLEIARYSEQQPWLVIHVLNDGNGPPRVFGVDLSDLDTDLCRIEGMDVVLQLPVATILTTEALTGARVDRIPVLSVAPEDPQQLALDKLAWLVGGLGSALQRDIEGARLRVCLGAECSIAEEAVAAGGAEGS